MAAIVATTSESPFLLVPYLLVFLAAATTVKSFLHMYCSSLRSIASLLTSSSTYAFASVSPPKSRRANGCNDERGQQDLFSTATAADAVAAAGDEQQQALTGQDVEEILRNMGLVGAEERVVTEGIYEEVSRIFDADEPSFEEARRAFAAFDEDKDGFISPADLRGALARLGFQADVSACRRMIDAANCSGSSNSDQGRVGLSQFVRFLESGF